MSTTISGDTGVDKFDGTTISGHVIQVQHYPFTNYDSGSVIIPLDTTIPLITEGKQFMSAVFVPKKANSRLKITVNCFLDGASSIYGICALFRDSASEALVCSSNFMSDMASHILITYVNAVSILPTTFTVRAGTGSAGTIYFNGINGIAYFGGSLASSITIEEIAQ